MERFRFSLQLPQMDVHDLRLEMAYGRLEQINQIYKVANSNTNSMCLNFTKHFSQSKMIAHFR